MFVDALTSDLDLNVLHKDVSQPVQPPECLTGHNGDGWKSHAEVHAVNQITVARDSTSYLLSPRLYHLTFIKWRTIS